MAQGTMGQGPAELQEAAEGEGGHMRLPPALRLLLHILLEFDPARCFPPLRLLVFVQQQLVQLHKYLGIEDERHGKVRARGPQGLFSKTSSVRVGLEPARHRAPYRGTGLARS